MTTLKERPAETLVAAAVDAPAAATAPIAAPAVDVSNVPETPSALLAEWNRPAPTSAAAAVVIAAPPVAMPAPERKPLLHTLISATLVRCWDALTGPGMTDQERTRREIAEHNGHAQSFRPRI